MRRGVALGAVGCCALALAASVAAGIAIGHGIAGVRLGMSQAAVRGKLGKPVKIVHAKNEFGTYTEFRYAGYVVDFQQNASVTSIATTLAGEKTPAGVGVGSSWAQVRRKVARVHCEGSPVLGNCAVGKLLPGKTVTDFFFKAGKVSRVLVGIVLD